MFHEFKILDNPEFILLVASIIFFFSIVAGKAGYRFGLPALLLFLGVGMLFGSDGLGIQFNNPKAAQYIGTLALSIILFSGGMDTKLSDVKPIMKEGVILATVGVLVTTLITGGFIYYLFLVFGICCIDTAGILTVSSGDVVNRLSFGLLYFAK